MAEEMQEVTEALKAGQTLAAADRVLIDPEPGTLVSRVDALLVAIRENGSSEEQVCRTLIQLGMNFVGRDAEIVGYGADEIEAALGRVLSTVDDLKDTPAMGEVVEAFLTDMKSVNLADSLSGLLAELLSESDTLSSL